MKLLVVAVLAGVALTGCAPNAPAAPVSNPAPSVAAPTPPPAPAPLAAETPALELTCEPDADARLIGDVIVNKDCPELNAAKEQAQREYASQTQNGYVEPSPQDYERAEQFVQEKAAADPAWVDFTWCLDAASQSDGATTAQEYDACNAEYKAAAGR